MFRKERERWMKLIEDERESHRKERQELLNRLAVPHTWAVDAPKTTEVAEPPTDPAEFAFVGSEVPEGVQVGELAVKDA